MAQIVLGVGSSHGPSIQSKPELWEKLAEKDTRDPRFDYQHFLRTAKPGLAAEITIDVQRQRYAGAHVALGKLRDVIGAAKLDVMVIISNPHGIRPDDAHPVFGVYRGATIPVGKRKQDAATIDHIFVKGAMRQKPTDLTEVPGNAGLANHLIKSLIARNFDIACVDRLRDGTALDDAFAFAYEYLLGGATLPVVPFMLSRDLPNQASPQRCFDLGVSLREVIAAWPENIRVGLLASGGLSHQVVDEELDRRVAKALVAGDRETLCAVSHDDLNKSPGTPEILNWITVAAAMAPRTMTLVDYLPAYRSVASTGHGLTFGYWQ